MRKRPQDQGSTSSKRSTPMRPATEQTAQITSYACSTPTRPATEQTPEKPSDAEATIHDPKSTPVLPRCDFAVEPDAAIEHIGMAWLSTIDDVTLIAIFEHLANCYAARPMVGTCKRIFTTWIMLQCWLFSLQKSSGNVRLLNRQESGNVGCIVGQSQRHPRETLS